MPETLPSRAPDSAPGPVPLDQRVLAAYEGLTTAERRLADTLIARAGELAQYSATELAGQARVSKATAARLFRKLGYPNYRQARREARESGPWGSPLRALADASEALAGRGDLARHIANDVDNLTRTARELEPAALARAVELLAGARRLLVVGFRNSHALASYAWCVLNTLKEDVRLLGAGGLPPIEQLAELDRRDLILAIGFRRRPLLLRQTLSAARSLGARSVLLSDVSASHTARLADVVLRCRARGAYLFDSYAAATSVINFLCSAVALELGERAWSRIAGIEALHAEFGDLVPRSAR